jgi:predicted metal-dependent phosphoesterase TrpH
MSFYVTAIVIVGAVGLGVVSVIAQTRHNRMMAKERSIRKSLGLPVSNSPEISSTSGGHGIVDVSSGSDCGSIGGCD